MVGMSGAIYCFAQVNKCFTTNEDHMASVDTTGRLWQEVVLAFRRACLLRYEGQSAESSRILELELPKAIAAWSDQAPGTPLEKRAALGEMFKDEQRRIDDAALVHRMVSKSLNTEILPSVFAIVAQQVREVVREQISDYPRAARAAAFAEPRTALRSPRIRFDDIGSIIDSVLVEQSADYGARPAPAFA